MLAIYTPNQPSADVDTAYKKALHYSKYGSSPQVCKAGTGFALQIAWCREIAVNNLRDVFADVPPGTLNIYGIRRRAGDASYQPSKSPGKIQQDSAYTDNLFTAFYQIMVEIISCILDQDNLLSLSRLNSWMYRWGSLSFNRHFQVTGESTIPAAKCILNYDGEDIPELDDSTFWTNDKMFGTLTGVPAHWTQSIPIMSYLLYIPRLWGAFYSKPRFLSKISKTSKHRVPNSLVVHEIMGAYGTHKPVVYSSHLWRYLARKMMLPLWFTSCGKEQFWTFTYLLIRASLGKALDNENKIPNLADQLKVTENYSGFISWCSWYSVQEGTPTWFKPLLKELASAGPSAVLHFGNISNYV